MNFNIRHHEFGPKRPRLRVWTDEMSGYGQFNVVSYEDVAELKRLADKIGIGPEFIVHHCDGISECQCKPLTFGEEIPRD